MKPPLFITYFIVKQLSLSNVKFLTILIKKKGGGGKYKFDLQLFVVGLEKSGNCADLDHTSIERTLQFKFHLPFLLQNIVNVKQKVKRTTENQFFW